MTLDGRTIRIKGTEVTTKVRYCSMDDDDKPRVVTEMCCLFPGHDEHPEAEQFVTEDNPYADFFPLDMIELHDPSRGWYTPTFHVRS